MKIIKDNKVTQTKTYRYDYKVEIDEVEYNFYILEIHYIYFNKIELWCGEYGTGIIDYMFGLKKDEEAIEVIKDTKANKNKLLDDYFYNYYYKYM